MNRSLCSPTAFLNAASDVDERRWPVNRGPSRRPHALASADDEPCGLVHQVAQVIDDNANLAVVHRDANEDGRLFTQGSTQGFFFRLDPVEVQDVQEHNAGRRHGERVVEASFSRVLATRRPPLHDRHAPAYGHERHCQPRTG